MARLEVSNRTIQFRKKVLNLRTVTAAFLIVLACVGYFAYAVASNRQPRNFWLLRVETASGRSNLLASRDEQSITDAVAAITAALESDVSVHSVITIADSTLITDSVIQNATIENVGRTE